MLNTKVPLVLDADALTMLANINWPKRKSETLLTPHEGEFARLGMQSSVGVPNFPATVWLYAIPYALFGADVQMATWFTGFVAVLAIPAVYTFGRFRWGV